MFLTKINKIMEIFLNKLFSKIKRETKKGREGGRKRERKMGRKERGAGRKKERGRETDRETKKRRNQALAFEFHCFLSPFGTHTHSEYEFSQLTPR